MLFKKPAGRQHKVDHEAVLAAALHDAVHAAELARVPINRIALQLRTAERNARTRFAISTPIYGQPTLD